MPTLQMEIRPAIKETIAADAAKNARSMNDLAREIIADYFGVRYEPTRRKTNGTRGGASLPIPLPQKLYDRVQLEAQRRQKERRKAAPAGKTPTYPKRELVERILCEHYGLDYDST